MRYFAIVVALASLVSATIIDVLVGANGSVAYTPSSVAANIGDEVRFTFVAKNHTVTQSSFATPCTTLTGGVDSGFQGPANNTAPTAFTQWSFTVNVTTPLWFYCQQTGHCQKGMVFAVNPTAAKPYQTFQNTAMGINSTNTTSSTSSASPLMFHPATTLGIVTLLTGILL